MNNHAAESIIKHRRIRSDGYVLPLVIITGMILTIGAVILSTRSFSGLIRSTRQKQGNEATELAETGASLLINELNEKFPYLLTVNCQVENNSGSQQLEDPVCTGWKTFNFGQYGGPNSACPGRSTNPSEIMDLLYKTVDHKNGAYRLRNYEFLGDQVQGGKAIIQVQGQRFRGSEESSEIAASAIVEQEITIVPKCCNQAPYLSCGSDESGWGFGLATKGVQLQLGDVIDENPSISNSNANVHCVNCDPPPEEQCDPWTSAGQTISNTCTETGGSIIAGERSNGPLDIPDAPTWNKEAWGDPTPIAINNGNNPIFSHGEVNQPHPISGCFTENVNGKKRTHCRIDSVNLSGENKISINPEREDGDIRFYIEGQQLNLSGDTIINPGEFGSFSIFGGESTNANAVWGCSSKQLNISGGGELNAFLNMPCFDVNLSGGSSDKPLMIKGAAISNQWNATGDYSRLVIPSNAGDVICDVYEICSSAENENENQNDNGNQNEFAALGSNQWSLIQMEQQ